MRLLVVGGTRFVGRHIVAAALDRGHDVTLFHRGASGDDPFPSATHVHGDRDGDLAELRDGAWDATVDVCAYVPRQVRSLGAALGGAGGRGGHYLLVSSISAYAEPAAPGVPEDAPLALLDDETTEEVTGATYGGLKALCERAAAEMFGPATAVVRPTYVVGPHDPTGRYTWWVRRLARGGDVLVAGPREQAVQTIDARDLADLVVRMVEQGAAGPVNAAAPAPPFSLEDLLTHTAAAVAPPGTRLVWVDPAFAVDSGLDGRDLPLWHGGEQSWIGAVDVARAASLGLRARPLADSARSVLDDDGTTPVVPGVGLAPDRERALLDAWRAAGAGAAGGSGTQERE